MAEAEKPRSAVSNGISSSEIYFCSAKSIFKRWLILKYTIETRRSQFVNVDGVGPLMSPPSSCLNTTKSFRRKHR